jgi:hypothetical protein
MDKHLYVVLGHKHSYSSLVVLFEETKICPKRMGTVVWDGWTRHRRVRGNSGKDANNKPRQRCVYHGQSFSPVTIAGHI